LGDPEVNYLFGESLTIRAVLEGDAPLAAATIFFASAGTLTTQAEPLTVDALAGGRRLLSYDLDLTTQPLRAFATVIYRLELVYQDGVTYRSPDYEFFYADNRFDWQNLSEQNFRVHWTRGDLKFAQSVLDVAQSGLAHIQMLLDLPTPAQIEIYIYPDTRSLQDTLTHSDLDWVAGHADPDLGVMVVALPSGPEQRLLMEQRIPHELMHIMLYQTVGPGYNQLPIWLIEGLASISELYPNPDYEILLDHARQTESFVPLANLCAAFPRDASNALLAYAESASFTRFLHTNFGASGLMALIDAYTNGLSCERGPQTALGRDLTQLERQWRQQTFAENPTLASLQALLPWLVLLLGVVGLPLGLTAVRLRQPQPAEAP
jgi:hypothetical protein